MKLLILISILALASATPATKMIFMSKFGFEICEKSTTNNVIVSPASVYTALGLAYLGAEGNTATEMQDVLGFQGKTKEQVAQHYADVIKEFVGSPYDQEVTKFQIANHIFVNQKYEVSPKFNELASKYFDTAAEKLNFAEATKAAEKINSWVLENTDQKIKNIISADTIDADDAMVLVNAIYFKAHWEHRFDASQTVKKDFHVSKGVKTTVDMMHKEHFYNYAELNDLDAKGIQIPFVKSDIYMLIVLPNDVEGLKSLQEKFKTANFTKLRESFSEQKVKLSMPKFSFEYKTSLKDTLKNLGLKSMFDNADFSGLFADAQSVPVGEIIHKAFIAVDEIGTEASADTLIEMGRMGRLYSEATTVYEFNADHPFMFVIKDADTFYFAGQVTHF